jgi:hypothetical protein
LLALYDLCLIGSFNNEHIDNVFSVSCQFRLVWYREGDMLSIEDDLEWPSSLLPGQVSGSYPFSFACSVIPQPWRCGCNVLQASSPWSVGLDFNGDGMVSRIWSWHYFAVMLAINLVTACCFGSIVQSLELNCSR